MANDFQTLRRRKKQPSANICKSMQDSEMLTYMQVMRGKSGEVSHI